MKQDRKITPQQEQSIAEKIRSLPPEMVSPGKVAGVADTASAAETTAKVSLIRCPSYEEKQLHDAIQRALALLGGIQQFITPQSRVLVKVNQLPPPSPPERGIVTHPAFVEQVLVILRESGIKVTVRVGDDIDVISTREGERTDLSACDGFAVSGLRQVCRKLGVELLSFREEGFKHVSIPQGRVLKETHMARAVLEADVVINLPKFKTHSLAVFTGAVKNIYGCIPQGLRIRYHAQFQGEERFNALLTDLFSVVRPQLNIMDAVVGMEGEGPANGDTRNIGLILASPDAVALDRVALAVAGIDPDQVYHLKDAARRGLGVYQLPNIRILGEQLENVQIPNFKTSRTSLSVIKKWVPDFLFEAVCRQFGARPRVIAAKCRSCGACEAACPAGAIKLDPSSGGVARIDSQRCIACMCCHEACRFGAIVPQRKLSARVLSATLGGLNKLRRTSS
jgi:uncharacterized protein (DUF362 family)/Pyruvate/2-oxoacid:ferredoxin oxidoreductase delta subunit